MTLDEAIKHAEDVAAKCFAERSSRNHSGRCGFEHLDLAAWLRELKELKEKDEPKTVRYDGDGEAYGTWIYDKWFCPNCNNLLYEANWKCKHCPECGQRLRWKE